MFLKNQLLSAGCSVALVLGGLAGPVAAETLEDALALAYQSNPTLIRQRAALRALDETYVQAETGLRARLQVDARTTHFESKDRDDSSPTFANEGFGSATLSQPIFTNGRVNAQMTAAEADIMSGRESLRAAEGDVLSTVVQAYVDVRRDQERLAISRENVSVLERQLLEVRARFKAGDLTRTDVAQSESRLAVAQANFASAEAALASSRAAYTGAVGQAPGELAAEPALGRLMPESIDAAMERTEQNNPQLLSFVYGEKAARARIAAARSQFGPTVSLQGVYGFRGQSTDRNFGIDNQPPPQFADYSRELTAVAAVSMPIFTGGLVESQVRQAGEQANVARAATEIQRRASIQRVAQAWSSLVSARATLTATDEQVRASKVAYEGVRQEAKVGLRTTLDVLNAEQELRQAELARVNARRDEYIAATAVLNTTGVLEARNLVPTAEIYDPKASFERIQKLPGPYILDMPLQHLDRALGMQIHDGAAKK